MTSRRAFNYAEFVKGWRALAADHGLDPITGCYNYADDAGWWKRPEMWTDAGISHSCVERDAIASHRSTGPRRARTGRTEDAGRRGAGRMARRRRGALTADSCCP